MFELNLHMLISLELQQCSHQSWIHETYKHEFVPSPLKKKTDLPKKPELNVAQHSD